MKRLWAWCCGRTGVWYGQSLGQRATIWFSLIAAGLGLMWWFGGDDLHTFGHPGIVDAVTLGLLILFCLTHATIAGIMYLQRSRWLPSDAAMFVFIATKALLWGYLSVEFTPRGLGISGTIAYLYIVIVTVTLHLDYRMVRRYLLNTKDEREEQPWDRVTERRDGSPGRRAYDQLKGRT